MRWRFYSSLCIILVVAALAALASCTSPEQQKKKRLDALEKYVTGVAMHLYDRNPETVRESMTHLFREELTEPVIEKLQKEGNLPKTELGIVKILTEAEENKTSNLVEVSEVKPLGPVEADVVPFQVIGKVTTKTEGKPDQVKPFSIKIAAKLNKQTGGWPQVVEVAGMTPEVKPAAKPQPPPQKKRGKRRRKQ